MDDQKSGCLVRRVQSTINIVDTSNNNKDSTPSLETSSDHDSDEPEVVNKQLTGSSKQTVDVVRKTCVFYVSEDEDNNVQDIHGDFTKKSTNNQAEQKIRRAIVKPCRRSRKSKLLDLTVNVEPLPQLLLLNNLAEKSVVTENENEEKPKSPILLPWKKSFESSPVNMVSRSCVISRNFCLLKKRIIFPYFFFN